MVKIRPALYESLTGGCGTIHPSSAYANVAFFFGGIINGEATEVAFTYDLMTDTHTNLTMIPGPALRTWHSCVGFETTAGGKVIILFLTLFNICLKHGLILFPIYLDS